MRKSYIKIAVQIANKNFARRVIFRNLRKFSVTVFGNPIALWLVKIGIYLRSACDAVCRYTKDWNN